MDLTGAEADFAVGCTYKYLNGGPGSPAFLWVHRDTTTDSGRRSPAGGVTREPFAMERAFDPAPDAGGFLSAPSRSSRSRWSSAAWRSRSGPTWPRSAPSRWLCRDLFIALVEQRCAGEPLSLITPREHRRRGSHVSFRHPEGYAVMQALIDRGVIGDYREPEVLRFGVTPLYLRHIDIWDAVETLRDILDTRSWDADRFRHRAAVT